jgi:hypothetical protein
MVRSVDFFVMFFSLADRPAFEKKKKDINKLQAPKGPADIKHYGGKVDVSITNEKISVGRNIASFGPICQTLYEKVIKADEDTVKIMRVLSEAFHREADLYKDLACTYASIEVFFWLLLELEQWNDRYV